MFIILVDIQSGDRVSLRLLPPMFPIIARASDISRANVAFEIVRRAQDPCFEVVPEDEGALRATFRDRGHFEVTILELMYRTLQARYTILEHSKPHETIYCEFSFRSHIYYGSKSGYNILPPQKYLFES